MIISYIEKKAYRLQRYHFIKVDLPSYFFFQKRRDMMFNDVPNRKEVEFETIKVSLYHTRKKSIFLNGLTIDFGGKLEDSFESVSFGALKHDV